MGALALARSTSSKSVVLVGDMHSGSKYAVKSPNATLSEEDGDAQESKQNPLQEKLFGAWQWAIDELEQRPYVLLLNGEPFDGPNMGSYGMSNWSTNLQDQMDDSMRLLKMYSYDIFLMTRGTRYHVERDSTSFEEMMARRMGATPYRAYIREKVKGIKRSELKPEGERSARTDYQMWFDIFGRLFSVTHHVGHTKWASYRPTPIAREMMNLELEAGKYFELDHHPTFVIRSHVHYFVGVMFGSSFGCTTPAWKFPDAHLLKGGVAGTAPSIGNVEIIIEQDGKWTVRPHVLPSKYYPKPKVLHL